MTFLSLDMKQIASKFYSNEAAIFASIVVAAMVVIYIIYSGIVYKFFNNKYHGIRFTTKNIAFITMLSAVSVSVTVVISRTVPITVFPPVRIAFEGVMVKITGFIFGPIVGLMSGVITDLLVMMFVPSFIHVSYIIVIASFGFISGLISVLNRTVGKHKWILFAFCNVFLIAFGSISILLTYYSDFGNNQIPLFAGFKASKITFLWLMVAGTLLTIVVVWMIMFITKRIDKNGKNNRYNEILPIILLAVINEYWVTTLISAWGDIAFLAMSKTDSGGYGFTMMLRFVQAPVKVIGNSTIIYVTYRAIYPLVKTD